MVKNNDINIRSDLTDISNTIMHLYELSSYFEKTRREFGSLWYDNDSDLQVHLSKIDDWELFHLMEEFYRIGKDASYSLSLKLPLINNEKRYPVISEYIDMIEKSVASYKKEINKLLIGSKKIFLKKEEKLGHWKIDRLVEIHKEMLSNLNALKNEFKNIKNSERYKIENNLKVDKLESKGGYKMNSIDYKSTNSDAWARIKNGLGFNKRIFGKKIYFVTDKFKRKIIFRDTLNAYILAENGFDKSAVILSGSIVEELLRLYLDYKNLHPSNNNFNEYIKLCEIEGILKKGISKLSHSVRHFRNIVHLENEISPKNTISKAAAKNAVSSIFIISNDF